MKRCILYGDGLISLPQGFGEALIDSIWLDFPDLPLQAMVAGEEGLTCVQAAKEAPPHLIGKSPHRILLSLGGMDAVSGAPLSESLEGLKDLLALLHRKTVSELWVLSLIPEFLVPAGASPDFISGFNSSLVAFTEEFGSRIRILEAGPGVKTFLSRHREGEGDKHSLHMGPDKLTSLGARLLAKAIYQREDWVAWA
jgi:hypothetical protein